MDRRVWADHGGIRGLLEVLTANEEAIEADLLRWFGVDLRHLGSPELSLRRLLVLLGHLPRESSTVRAIAGERARWGDSEHLLADLIDAVQSLAWQHAWVHSRKKPQRPKPHPRPGVDRPGERRFGRARMTIGQARRYLDRFKPPKG